MADRRTNFERAVADYDAKALGKCVDFAKHRFVSIERDAATSDLYVKGHRSLRAACDEMARATEEGEPYVPEKILDLDSGTEHPLDLFAFVVPQSVDAVPVILPREAADFALTALGHVELNVETERLHKVARSSIEKALARRR